MTNNAFKIITPNLIVRKYELTDAPQLKKVVGANVDHLLPWLPWAADEPQTLEEKQDMISGWHENFEQNKDYVYAIFAKDNTQLMGGTGLHTRRGEGIFEIGYWMDKAHINKGYTTEAAYALTKVGIQYLGIEKMEIHHTEKNVRSARVPEKLGYLHEYTYRKIEKNAEGQRIKHLVWTMFKEEFEPIEKYDKIEVYDKKGDWVLPL